MRYKATSRNLSAFMVFLLLSLFALQASVSTPALVKAADPTPTTTPTPPSSPPPSGKRGDMDAPPPDPKPKQQAPMSQSPAAGSHYGSSPFAPPEKDDTTFVVDVAPGLDTGCTFRSGGPLVFDIKVDRYAGDIQKLLAAGKIPSTAVLRLPAYDVDLYGGGGYYAPELDRVSINGHVVPGEYLTGDNNIWKLNAFNIPLEWLNFPADPGDNGTLVPVNNTVQIDIDTANYYEVWCTAIDWAALTIEVPQPLLMVHGILSSGATWNSQWTPNLNAIGLPSATINMGNLDSIQNNAGKISAKVESLKKRWGVKKINILSHSKGGLDSRDYIESSDSVDKLVQLGTPNAGSPLADLVQSGAIGLFGFLGTAIIDSLAGGASYQLTTPYMGLYNAFHGYNSKVVYNSLAGDYRFGGLGIKDALLRAFYGGPSDTIVPVWSVYSLGFTNHLPAYQSSGSNKQAQHTSLTGSSDIYNQVLPLLIKSGTNAPVQGPPAPASQTSTTLTPITSTPVSTAPLGGALSAGATGKYQLPVDSSGPVAFMLISSGGQLDMKLTSPSGVPVDPTAAAGSSNIEYDAFDENGQHFQIYAFNTTETGNWQVQITAQAVTNSSSQEPFSLAALISNTPVQLQPGSDLKSYHVGQPVVLQAKLSGGVTGPSARVTAKIVNPDNTFGTIDLVDDGTGGDAIANDGIYTGQFRGTTQSGIYRTLITATGTTTAFSRSGILMLPVSASTSQFTNSFSGGGVDTDGDSLFNNLTVNVGLNITTAGNYHLLGVLLDPNGAEIARTNTALTLGTGTQTANLVFDGKRIYEHGVDGPYSLSLVRLAEDNAAGELPLDERTNVFTSAAYQFSQFQHPGIFVPGTGTDFGIDTNGNKQFDLLQVNLDVRVSTPGYYTISGHLVDRNGTELGFANGVVYLPVGANQIGFVFDGLRIGTNGVDGPYYLNDLLIFNNFTSTAIFKAYTTAAYPVGQFEGAPVVTTPLVSKASSTPAPNAAGWNNSDVQVTLEASGGQGGVKQITYSASGGQSIPQTVAPGATVTIPINLEGTTTISFFATDNAGNNETSHTFVVNLDKTPPTITYSGNAGEYTIDQVIAITCSAADNKGGSGLLDNTCKDLQTPAFKLPLGINTLSATADDIAGNAGSGSTSFNVKLTYQSLCGLTGQFLAATKPQLTNSFCVKLSAAENAAAQGNSNAKAGSIQAYQNELSAQTGKALTAEQAAILKQFSTKL